MECPYIVGKNILIAGGASLVGAHLTKKLVQQNAGRILVFDPLRFDSKDSLGALKEHPHVTLLSGDLTQPAEINKAMEGIDLAVNLAAYMSLGMSENPQSGLEVNITGHINFLNAAVMHQVQKVVFASSSATYGFGIGGAIDETKPLNTHQVPPGAVAYGASKLIGEQLCKLYHAQHGLPYANLRFSTVYGEHQHRRAANALYIIDTYERLRSGLKPQIFGDGRESKDFVYAGDVARAICMAFDEHKENMTVNISGGKSLSLVDIINTVMQVSGLHQDIDYVQDDGRVRLPAGENLYYDNTLAKYLLGWEPNMPFAEGVKLLINGYENALRGE
jgi:UDP-glucose 4-epimerase